MRGLLLQARELKKVAEANGIPAGLDGVDSNVGDLKANYEAFKDARIYPYFDRSLLPNGMQDLLAGA